MRVLLLAGGASNERDVSLTSGAAVFESLGRLGHQVYALDPASGNSLLNSDGKFLLSAATKTGRDAAIKKTDVPALAHALSAPEIKDVDVVFIALHGGAGENGVIQCLLELAGKAYTGSDMTASAIAMDKAIAKRLFSSAGIATPEWELYRLQAMAVDEKLVKKITQRFTFPIIVKPNDGGSTIGLSIADNETALRPALEKARSESHNILVEEYIAGRELTVAVLDGEALPVVEIKPQSGLYDYEAKYTKGKSEYIVPAEIDPATAESMQETAVKAYNVIGASGLVRIDFILAENGEFFCLEVNTVPGMTNLSLAPMAARAVGIEFEELIERLLQSAIKIRRSGTERSEAT
jgi:D-alanine-D-alanine ligase